MKKVNVEITGITPLLMHSPKSMIDENVQKKLKTQTKDYDLVDEARKFAYINSNGELYVPAEAIKGALINASSYKKFGKYSAKPIIAGGVFITEPELSLKTKEYDLDIRTVVIRRARVVKARPKINNWKLNFELQYDENMIGSDKLLKPILVEAGRRIGLLDFRPEKNGSFGMFKVTKWEKQ